MKRAYVYIDGFNLYYRALRSTPHKWLNPQLLAESLLDSDNQVEAIRYFTAPVSLIQVFPFVDNGTCML